MPKLFKFLKSLVKKLQFFKRGDSWCKTNSANCKNLQHGSSIFLSVSKFWSYIYLLLLKILRIFLFRIAAPCMNLCVCSYFAVAKNPRDFSSYAAHNEAPCVSYTDNRCPCVCVTDKECSVLLWHVYKFCRRQAANSDKSGEPLLHRERPRRSFLTNDLKNLKSVGVP
jgi:hypothetical protein